MQRGRSPGESRSHRIKVSDEVGLHVVVQGRVQGVSFHCFVVRKARSLALKGYVYNLPGGGSVEVVAEGDRKGLEELFDHLNQGPTGSVVQQVDVSWTESSVDYEDFRVVYRMPVDGPWNNISWAV